MLEAVAVRAVVESSPVLLSCLFSIISVASLSASAAVSPSYIYGRLYEVSGRKNKQKNRLAPFNMVQSLKNHLHPLSAIRYPEMTGPTCEPPERNRAKSAIAVAKYLSMNKSAIILGPR